MQINLQKLKLIKQKFDNKLLNKDYLLAYLSDLLNLDQKVLQPLFQSNIKLISWSQFLEILDAQNDTNHKLFDHGMYDNSTKFFQPKSFQVIRPKNSYLEHLPFFEKIHYFQGREPFVIIVFDDQTIVITQLNNQYNIIVEFTVPKIIVQLEKQTEKLTQFPTIPRKQNIQQELEYLAKEVNINPWTLLPISKNPKMQLQRQKRAISEYTKLPVKDQKIVKNKLFVCAIATYQNLIYIALITKEVKIYSLEYDAKQLVYALKDQRTLQFQDIVKDMHITYHRVKKQQLLLLILANNQLVIQTLNQQQLQVTKIPINVELMYAKHILVMASFKGEYCILMDHKEGIYSISSIQTQQQNSIAALDYSEKHKIIVFGSLYGKVQLLDVCTAEKIGEFKLEQDPIVRVFSYDTQNQFIVVQSKIITIFDIQRLNILQQLTQRKVQGISYEIRQAILIDDTLICASNRLESWIAMDDEERQAELKKLDQLYLQKKDSLDLSPPY